MKIICDFDRTIFDTNRFYKTINEQKPPVQVGTIESLRSVDVPGHIFSDALDYLYAHSQHQFYIVSSAKGKTGGWDIEYQKEKLRESKIAELMTEVYVVENEKASIVNTFVDSVPAIFIDDLEEHLVAVTQKNPSVTGVLIDRDKDITHSDFPIINSFLEVDAIIEKI